MGLSAGYHPNKCGPVLSANLPKSFYPLHATLGTRSASGVIRYQRSRPIHRRPFIFFRSPGQPLRLEPGLTTELFWQFEHEKKPLVEKLGGLRGAVFVRLAKHGPNETDNKQAPQRRVLLFSHDAGTPTDARTIPPTAKPCQLL